MVDIRRVFSLVLVFSLISFVYTTANASTTAKVYYNASLTAGTTASIRTYLENMGYTATRTTLPTKATLRNAFGNNSVVHVLSHGAAGSIVCSNGSLTANTVDNYYYNSNRTSSAKLIFLECCNCGSNSNTNGNYPNVFSRAGVRSSISFADVITASSATNGVHFFSKMTYIYLKEGNTVRNSVLMAKADLFLQTDDYWGTDSVVIKGGNYTIP